MADSSSSDDERWMAVALQLAERAAALGEVPVGAVVVYQGEIVGEGWNGPISSCDPTAHAEMIALRQAALRLKNYRLPGAKLYVSIEPCPMCAGAMVHARIDEVVFAAREPKAGAVVSNLKLLDQPNLNHSVAHREGVCAEEASQLMQSFFRRRRAEAKQRKALPQDGLPTQ